MERNAALALLAVIVAAVLVALALVALPSPSRRLTVDELRAGVDFVLGGVRIQET